jgi:DNA-binding transcriptional LysR family regulator
MQQLTASVLLPQQVVQDDLDSGALCRVLPAWSSASTTVYALSETRLIPAKTQRFIAFLREQLAQ